jgi:type II secretory pathway pseudopilin PulG
MAVAPPIALSTLGIVLIVLGVIVILFAIGGFLAVRARARRQEGTWEEHVRAADAALEQARAGDRGWHRETMEEAARSAIAESRPGWGYDDLHLVFVDDRPGVTEDRAHFVAVGPDGESRVILARQDDRWVAERVE